MPKFIMQRWHGIHMWFVLVALALLTGILFYYQWLLGMLGLFAIVTYVFLQNRIGKQLEAELEQYLTTITYRVKKAGEEVFEQLPLGIILYNEENLIEWYNPFIAQLVGSNDSLVGLSIQDILPELVPFLGGVNKTVDTSINGRIYKLVLRAEERLIYLRDITEWKKLEKEHREEELVFGIIQMDNVDELAQAVDEQTHTMIVSKVIRAITEWTQQYDMVLRRYTNDKFFCILNRKTLQQLEQNRFDLLDMVRGMTKHQKIPLTLSIGIGAGIESMNDKADLAKSSLDIALGRGGDQAAVKDGPSLSFYGGKSNAIEKRTRVRARVISHAMRDLIRESDLVLIMTHVNPDLDAMGAAIGVLKAVQANGQKGFIVLDDHIFSIRHLMDEIERDEELKSHFISKEQALQKSTNRTLVVVVDTHRPSMVVEPKLVSGNRRIFVIDHHRRSEEFMEDPVLVYMEPYASSTCELVTELLQYHQQPITMNRLESTSLLAGIVVDTRNFMIRTGYRTFDAASYLKTHGADPSLVQKFLKEDLTTYIERNRFIDKTRLIFPKIALSTGHIANEAGHVLISQVADTLLGVSGIEASFVMAERDDGVIAISARSLGDLNVQVIMERMGGGGHLSSAAVQLSDTSMEETEKRLIEEIQRYLDEGSNIK